MGSVLPSPRSACYQAAFAGGETGALAGEERLRNSRTVGRVIAAAAVVLGVALVTVVLLRNGGTDYKVYAHFQNASQIVEGNLVQVAGTEIGEVSAIKLTDNGEARLTLRITKEGWAPLREGTEATIRQASLSGVANRYVDLKLAPDDAPELEEGAAIPASSTTSTVDLDQIFNTFDRKTRDALGGVVRGFADQYRGRGEEANKGWLYLNPSLAASSRLFRELDRDTPLLERFIVSSSKLVTDLAERRDDLAGVVRNLDTTFGAIGRRKTELARSLQLLPQFMRRANTTFVNLRATIDDLEPLVEESKPVTPKLRRLLAELRPLTRDARPTLRDLSKLIRRRGADNDLIEATQSLVPVRDIAVRNVQRNGREREGALPASTKALQTSTPELGFARPYAVDLTGWFDDFSHSGVYDALGGESRAAPHVNAFVVADGLLQPVPENLRDDVFRAVAATNQRNRCPGAADYGTAFRPTPDYNCDPTHVLPSAPEAKTP
jgi:phospholipid/cholesterol/gamma-HCH transport system substrate-binding protein